MKPKYSLFQPLAAYIKQSLRNKKFNLINQSFKKTKKSAFSNVIKLKQKTRHTHKQQIYFDLKFIFLSNMHYINLFLQKYNQEK